MTYPYNQLIYLKEIFSAQTKQEEHHHKRRLELPKKRAGEDCGPTGTSYLGCPLIFLIYHSVNLLQISCRQGLIFVE